MILGGKIRGDKVSEQSSQQQPKKPKISNPLDPWKDIKPIPLAAEERAK